MPLFQNESKCETIHELVGGTHFRINGFTLIPCHFDTKRQKGTHFFELIVTPYISLISCLR